MYEELKKLATDRANMMPEDDRDLVLALVCESDRLNRESQNLSDQLGRCDRERRELKAENESLKKDAERYQVLRQANIDTIHNGGLFAGLTPDNVVINGCDLDDRTDAVIRSRKDVDQ